MKRFLVFCCCLFILALGTVMIFSNHIEAIFSPAPTKDELVPRTVMGPYKIEIKVSPGKWKTRYANLTLENSETLHLIEPKLDQLAAALASGAELSFGLRPESNNHHRQVWQVYHTDSQTTILAYEDCLAVEANSGLVLNLMGYIVLAFGFAGLICCILGIEDDSSKGNALGCSTVIVAALLLYWIRRDDIHGLISNSEKKASTEEQEVKSTEVRSTLDRLPFVRKLVSGDGREMEAKILRIHADSVDVERVSDGQQFQIKLESLSGGDRKFFQQWGK